MFGSLLLIGTLACQAILTRATPVPPDNVAISEFEDLPILVPDTSKVDSSLLKQVGAEKFLSLWFIFVLSGKVVISDEPWTLLVPLNSGLPKDPLFLLDKEYTREMLLNHAVIGDAIDLQAATSGSIPFHSLADTELLFTKKGEKSFVNGIPLSDIELKLGNAAIYVIERFLPLVGDELVELSPVLGADGVEPVGDEILNLVENGVVDSLAEETSTGLGKLVALPEVTAAVTPILTTAAATTLPQSNDPPKATPRTTRFDKFRKNANTNGESKSETDTSKRRDHLSIPPRSSSALPLTSTATQDLTTTTTTSPSPTTTDIVVVPSVVKENLEDFLSNSNAIEKEASVNTSEFLVSRDVTFLDSLTKELEVPNSKGAEFMHHFLDAHLEQYLSPDKNYTAIIPTNDAFYDYYPIDWGFNPFLVENFTKDVLLNHIIEGDIHLQKFNDIVEIQTLGGRTIEVSKDKDGTLLIHGQPVPQEMEVELTIGRIYFLDQLLFVDYDRVNALRDEYPFLETAPLLSFPWPTSPFLSHLLKRLQENEDTKLFAHLLRNSDIAHLVSSSDDNLSRLSYTAFVPTDEALKKSFRVESLAVLERKAINDFLLEHIVPGYLFNEDFEDGFSLLSLTNKPIPIKTIHGNVFVGPSRITKPQQFVYNLGTIFIIDRPFEDIPIHEAIVTSTTQPLVEDVEIVSIETSPSHSENKEGAPKEHLSTDGVENATEAAVAFEVRTEISFSRQINDGQIVPVPREIVEQAKSL